MTSPSPACATCRGARLAGRSRPRARRAGPRARRRALAVHHPAGGARSAPRLGDLSRATRAASSRPQARQPSGTPLRTGGPRGRPAPSGARRGSSASERLDVPLLVEHVGGEREVERLGQRLRQSSTPRVQRRGRFGGVLAQQLDRVRRPSRSRDHARPRAAATSDGHAEAAAELDDPSDPARLGRERPRSASRGGPELGPVRQELVVRERLLVEQRIGSRPAGAARARPPPHRTVSSRSSSAGSEQRSSPTVTPGRQLAELARARAARPARRPRARSCRGGSSASGRGRRAAPPGARRGRAAARSGSGRRPPCRRRSPSPSRRARRASSRGGAR